MTDFNTPTNSSLYTDVLTQLNAKIASVAKMDYTGDTNLPTGTIRHDSSTLKLQKWNGSSWVDITVHFGNSVGIKNTSPGYDLHVTGDTGVTRLLLHTTSAATGLGLYAPAANTLGFLTSGTEYGKIDSSGFWYLSGSRGRTTMLAANCHIDSGDGGIYRSTSSGRYKKDVEDLAEVNADAVLSLRPVWYRSKAEHDPQAWSFYGLIAEEVAAVDPRLVLWGYPDDAYETYLVPATDTEGNPLPPELDEEGNELPPVMVPVRRLKVDAERVPEGVMYDRVAVLLLDVVKRQRARLDAMEERLAALEAKTRP